MPSKDYYTVLGVPKGASQKEIRQTYRRLARQHHPDVNPGDKAAEARFKEINAAYEVLSDPERRRKYDRYGDQWQHADQIEEMQRRTGGRAFRFGPGGVSFDVGDLRGFGDLGSTFESFFGERRRGPRKGADLEQRVEVTLEEAFRGATRTLQLASEEPCATCGGSGQIASAVCHVCRGSGVALKARRLEVKIPPGVDTGSRVRIAGEGQASTGRGGHRGDLYLIVSVRPHPHFQRKGSDLYTDVEIPLTDAVLGAEVEVPTITGKVLLKVPPLSQNGKVFRLASLGLPHLKGSARGHLYARLEVRLPERLDQHEKKLFEELRAAGV
ncbi:MAG: hypothetical protein A2148_07745 [Chloroflexi bacterium RBG_16_68_14]|nr:MAG: hypothetical protein A2148_07745 [Chloroflexi bacterium RBG_16_68_14]